MKFSEFLKNVDFSWFESRILKFHVFPEFPIGWSPLFNNIGNSKWYMRLVLACNTWWSLFKIFISISNSYCCQKIGRRRREQKSTLWKFNTKIFVRQDNELDQNLTFAHLAKVFRFTFAKWISPSPLAKCEGLCASLMPWLFCVYLAAQ